MWYTSGIQTHIVLFIVMFKQVFLVRTILVSLFFVTGLASLVHAQVQSVACEPLQVGDLFKVPGVSTVYVLNQNRERLYYPNSPVFQSWHDSRTTVIHEINPTCVDQYPIPRVAPYGVNFLPGTLIKIPSSARVYAIAKGGVLYQIPSEQVAASIFGSQWTQRVKDVSEVFWQNYRISTSTLQLGVPIEGMLASANGIDVYEFQSGVWVRVTGAIPSYVRPTIVSVSETFLRGFPTSGITLPAEALTDYVATTGLENLRQAPEWEALYDAYERSQIVPTPAPVSPPSRGSGGGGGGGGSSPSPTPTPPPPTPPPALPDLTVSGAAVSTTVGLGQIIRIGYTVGNTGSVTGTAVTLTATVPTGTTFSTSESSGTWSCANGSVAGTSCIYTVGTVALSSTNTTTFALNTLSAGLGTVTTSVSVAGAESDTTNSDNSTSTVVTVLAPNLGLSVTSTYPRVTPSSTMLFAVSYGNTGTAIAPSTTITVPVPTGTLFSSASSSGTWSCANGSVAGTSCVTSLGSVGVGATGTITFAVFTTSSFTGNVTSTATITDNGSNGTDSDSSNNAASHTIRVAVLAYTDSYITNIAADLTQYSSTSPATYATLQPFKMSPGTGSNLNIIGGVLGFASGATPPTVSHPTPLPTSTVVAERYAHTLLVSGDGAGQTAGIFGEVDGRVFSVQNGFIVRARVSRETNNNGARGTILMMGTNFGSPGFEPSYLENGFGYGFDSSYPTSSGYSFFLRTGTYNPAATTTGLIRVSLGAAAPRDNRIYEAIFINEAGSPTVYARLNDLSDPNNPVIADERTFTIPSTTGIFFPEVNASPGPNGSGQTPQSFRIYYIDGFRYLPNGN